MPTLLQPVQLRAVLERPLVQHSVLALILINAVSLGLETSADLMARWGGQLMVVDRIILSVFVVEILARIYAYRGRFFRDPWSLFDFSVVAIALVPASGPFAVLRALRVLRVLRILTIVPSMRRVVGGLLAAIPGLGAIAAVLALVFYVFAVIATNLFGAAFPDWFGAIGPSLYTLFQIMTLESWSMGIVRPVMEVYPQAWAFFIPFILVATFTMLNLFIGIIVNAMQQFRDDDAAAGPAREESSDERVIAELHALRAEIAALRCQLGAAVPGREGPPQLRVSGDAG
ncbi:MAG: ion transporter [Pseudomonadales bacterium]